MAIGKEFYCKRLIVRLPATVMCERVDQVTKEDIFRVATKIIHGDNSLPSSTFPSSEYDKFSIPSKRTGMGQPTVYIRGPLFSNDPLYEAESILSKWGFGQSKKSLLKKASAWFR